ncbi:MAG: PHP domain-containing protein, partial [Pseudomonadota bacterium]
MKRPPENPPIAFRKPVVPKAMLVSDTPAYGELQCTTNFSFLRGASHPGELVIAAKAMGLSAVGVADRNTLAGVVRAHAAAKKEGLRLLVGARIDTLPDGFLPRHKNGKNERLSDSAYKDAPPGFSCLLYPTDRAAWGRLCALLTKGKRIAPKGECHLSFEDLLEAVEGQVVIVIPPEDGVGFSKQPSRPAPPLSLRDISPARGEREQADKLEVLKLAPFSPLAGEMSPQVTEGGRDAQSKHTNFITRLTQIASIATGCKPCAARG